MCGLCLRRTGVNPLWLFWGNFSRKTTGSKIKQEKADGLRLLPSADYSGRKYRPHKDFLLLDITIFRWVATTCSSEQQGL